jgi:hypothetical protein
MPRQHRTDPEDRTAMGTKSKFFRAFVEGNTISDGRTITGAMINEIVATFNAETYTPRINVEHISGYSPEPPFNGYGSVVAVKAEDVTLKIDGKDVTRRALYCQVDGNAQLVDLAKRDQKPFPSVELTDSYAGTGKVGMVGLAFTDRPASIGTEALKFSRNAPGTVFATGDEAPAIEFEVETASASIADSIVAMFSAAAARITGKTDEKPKVEETPKPKEPANDNFSVAIAQLGTQFAAALKPVTDAQAAMDARFTKLEEQIANTEAPSNFSRTPSTGGGTAIVTDC